MHEFILHNGRIINAADRTLGAGQVGLLSGWGVFSTIRVKNGVLFAWERHWRRMLRDAQMLRVSIPFDESWVRAQLLELLRRNRAAEATMRVALVRNRGGMWQGPGEMGETDLIALTTDLKQWGESVRLAVEPNARQAASRFAGTKILSWCMNLAWLEEAQARGYDEVLLLNERDEVCELTSANIFAAFGEEVRTPPLSSGCLPGVTRELLLEEISTRGIRVRETTLRLGELGEADGVFVTSTTRNLLPVREIEGLHIRTDTSVLARLGAAFAEYIEQYTARHKQAAPSVA